MRQHGMYTADLIDHLCDSQINHQTRQCHPYRLDIHHRPWALQVARATIAMNTMADASHLTIDGAPALLHFSARQDVVAWAPERLDL